VWERFDKEFTIVVYSHAQVYLWLKRKDRYFPWIEQQLRRSNLPDDLKFVAVAESDLLPHARSPKGATGPWQFISSTGKRYGLSQTTHVDERRDFEKATASAFGYLRDLHGMFNNWTLAIAAYNCGEGRVKKEMDRQGVHDYYSLKLPLETERYILRILAIKEVLNHPERYGYHLPKGAGYPPMQTDKVSIRLRNPVSIKMMAGAAGTTYREFKILNAAFISDTVPAGSYMLNVPKGKGEAFKRNMGSIGSGPIKIQSKSPPQHRRAGLIEHRVKPGESLGIIAQRYNVSVKDIRRWNDLPGDVIRQNQNLKIFTLK
jgi:hypothetical protein